ncbi:hypothetical protein [Burkholderia vietnamiensis]|uniref:hypothetical protein n=1 Tax=Burkholderia vietnamiensis TaxID=60552 RepID=UPI001593CB1D|nr:hypothetical protein [Burkholderia vietnamiensis]
MRLLRPNDDGPNDVNVDAQRLRIGDYFAARFIELPLKALDLVAENGGTRRVGDSGLGS